MVITPWVDILAGRLNRGDCALSMTDNTTSARWMQKSNFREESEPVQAAARILVTRTHARHYMNLEIRDYSLWFQGKDNNVADSLSRDFHLSDAELTLHITKQFLSQVTFQIVPLRNKIVSWMTSLLLTLPINERFKEAHTPTKLTLGNDGQSIALNDNNELKSSEPSQTPYSKDDLREALQVPWLLQYSAIPSITWLRPFAVRDTPTQSRTATDN